LHLHQQLKATVSILIVEDNGSTNEVIALMVATEFPYAVIYSASDGKRGAELYKKHTPDIIITDIQMPVMDGIEMAIEIKLMCCNPKIIVFTAYNDGNFVKRCNDIGVYAYLLKPLGLPGVIEAVGKCIKEMGLSADKLVCC
jgi:YesN/AraC family two-component response regulator